MATETRRRANGMFLFALAAAAVLTPLAASGEAYLCLQAVGSGVTAQHLICISAAKGAAAGLGRDADCAAKRLAPVAGLAQAACCEYQAQGCRQHSRSRTHISGNESVVSTCRC